MMLSRLCVLLPLVVSCGGVATPASGRGAVPASSRTVKESGALVRDATAPGQAEAGPRRFGTAVTGSVEVSGATVANAARVVAGMRAGFRNCFNRALPQNPGIAGSLALKIAVGPGGEVQSVQVTGQSGKLPDSVVACARARAQAAQFGVPVVDGGGDGGLPTITLTVTFAPP